jgi:RNA polymerase sigma-70 factor (ECF subfamily)
MDGLAASFMRVLADESSKLVSDRDGLESELVRVVREASEAWPQLDVPDEEFMAHLAVCMPRNQDPVDCLRSMQSSEVYLALASSSGDPRAVDELMACVGPAVRSAIRRAGAPPGTREDLEQAVWERLFAKGVDGRSRILQYKGLSKLKNWAAMVASRVALQKLASDKALKREGDSVLLELAARDDTPELQTLKQLYRSEFKEAFGQAIDRLTSRSRNLLRYNLLDGLSITRIAALYKVHRTTADRWMRQVRQQLLKTTRANLGKKLKVSKSELDSIMKLIQSQLQVNMSGLLAPSLDTIHPDLEPEDS